jgi:ribosomal protein RSM22 (predicted rRNA methylase)
MSKHTPGPWEALKNNYGQVLIVVRSTKDFVCAVPDECEADAKLISAAPDLLAALKSIIDTVESHARSQLTPAENSPVAKARAAIKKAEGV